MSSYILNEIRGSKAIINDIEEIKHLRIKRLKKDENVTLIGGGYIYNAKYINIDNDVAYFNIIKVTNEEIRVPVNIFVGITDRRKIDIIAEKAGELGVKGIGFFIGEKSKQYSYKINIERIKKRIISGMKQSDNPNYTEILGVFNSINDIKVGIKTIVLYWKSSQSLSEEYNTKIENLIIGPKEGFSDNELNCFRDKKYHFATLGENLYRVETAFIIASYIIGKNCI